VEHRLEDDIRTALEGAACEIPAGFAVQIETAEEGPKSFDIEYSMREVPAAAPPEAVASSEPEAAPQPAENAAPPRPVVVPRLVPVRGKTVQESYPLEKPRTNIGRLRELTDNRQQIVRRNDVVFEEGADEANASVSRAHAHIRLDRETGQYRICDDESEYGTHIFRDGRSIEVPAGNRRGERLCSGDEIYIGRACLRYEQ